MRDVLADDVHAATLDDIARAIAARGVSADPSSVFRAVIRLADEHVLQRVDLGDGQARFERSGPHHEHLVCTRCHDVTAVEGCLVSRSVSRAAQRMDFVVSGHTLVVTGTCRDCR